MANRSIDEHPLSPEEREFLSRLLEEKRSTILYVMKEMLDDTYYRLRDDCLSELYLLAVRKIDVLIKHPSPGRWLIVAAKYLALNARSKSAHRTEPVPLEEIEALPSSEDVFETALYNIWTEQDIYGRLKSELTKREREIFELLFEQQKSAVSVAAELGISESTVWNIRKSIKDKYKAAIKKKYT